MLRFRFLIIFYLCASCLTARASDCFSEHLREARELNQARAPIYAQLSEGRSEIISDQLILGEDLVLWFWAHSIDKRGESFNDKGMNIICDEFVSMKRTPPQATSIDLSPPNLRNFVLPELNLLIKEIRFALDLQDFPGVSRLIEEKLSELNSERRFNCMTRHVLDSMLRISNLAIIQDQKARQRNLPSTLSLSEDLIKGHLFGLLPGRHLDRQAAPLQAAGIPIICQDVPSIPATL